MQVVSKISFICCALLAGILSQWCHAQNQAFKEEGLEDRGVSDERFRKALDLYRLTRDTRFVQTVRSARGFCSDAEFEKWTSEAFRTQLTRDQVVEIGNAIIVRIVGEKISKGISFGNSTLKSIGALFLVVREYKRGMSLLDKHKLLTFEFELSGPGSSTDAVMHAIGDSLLDPNELKEAEVKNVQPILNRVQTGLLKYRARDLPAFESWFQKVTHLLSLQMRVMNYGAARELGESFLQRASKMAVKTDEDSLSLISMQTNIHQCMASVFLALGKEKESSSSICEFLESEREHRKVYWRAYGKRPVKDVEFFRSIWLDLLKIGRGPQYPSSRVAHLQEFVGYFWGNRLEYVYPIPVNRLPEAGKKLAEKRKGQTYVGGKDIAKQLKVLIDDPEFQKASGVSLLYFPLVEYHLANGDEREAVDTLAQIESDWNRQRKKLREEWKLVFNNVGEGYFEFQSYRRYLATYFACPRFRELTKTKGAWKNHEHYFHFKRPIPKFDQKERKQDAVGRNPK